jgi:hypothetical protein
MTGCAERAACFAKERIMNLIKDIRLMESAVPNVDCNSTPYYCGKIIRYDHMECLDVIQRLLFDYEAARQGFQNYICPKEIGSLLERLYKKEFVSPEVSQYAIDILLDQQVDHKLNGKLCGEVPIAHKTGEDDGLSNDVGIVFAKEPFVICFAGHDTDVYRWEDLIRRSAYDLVHGQITE